ncbi:MAG: hypothetical protein LUD15_03280, partial [Bacteroides sp.]|nr:hypothetical protein [Bacteroides sp.]
MDVAGRTLAGSTGFYPCPGRRRKKEERKKREKPREEWSLPKLTGVENFDLYLLTVDTLYNKVNTYT